MSETTTTEVSTVSNGEHPVPTGAEALQSTETGVTEQTADEKAAAEALAAEGAKQEKAQKRIDKAVRAQREAERATEVANTRAQELERRLAAQDPEQARIQLEEAEINRRAEAKAKQMMAQRDAQQKISAFDEAGRGDLGSTEWDDACNAVAAMGASKRPDFVPIISDIDNGYRAIAHLNADPDLAEKILALSPHKMAIELAKLADKPVEKKAKKVSDAPAPIKTLSGANVGNGYRAGMTVEEHVEWCKKNAPYKPF